MSIKKIFFSLIIIILSASSAFGAPAISGLTGVVANGETLIIAGTGFGSETAAPLISSYDNATSANNWSGGGSIGGSWNVTGSVSLSSSSLRNALYQSSYKGSYDADGSYANVGYNHTGSDDKIYASWWMYRDYSAWKGNDSGGGNSKFYRLYSNNAANDSIVLSYDWSGESLEYTYGQAEYAPDCGSWAISYSGVSASKVASGYWKVNFGNANPALQTWEHYEILVDYPSSVGGTNATVTLWKNGQTIWRSTSVAIDVVGGDNDIRWFRLGQVSGDRTETQTEYLDQVYFNNSIAHVFISDSGSVSWPDQGAVHHSEIQVCSSWSDTSITLKVNQGSISNLLDGNHYLYVIDGSGAISSGYQITGKSAALTGTYADGATEAEAVAGTEGLVITLTGDTWDATMGTNVQLTKDLIVGIDSGGAEVAAWDAEIKGDGTNHLTYLNITRTNSTVVTIDFDAEASYAITTNETITVTVPASALTGDSAIVASPTFEITASNPAVVLSGTLLPTSTEAEIVTGSKTIIATISDATWHDDLGTNCQQTTDFIQSFDAALSPTYGWNNIIRDVLTYLDVTRDSATQATIVLPAAATYDISANESVSGTMAASTHSHDSDINATPTVSIIFFETSSEEIKGITMQ